MYFGKLSKNPPYKKNVTEIKPIITCLNIYQKANLPYLSAMQLFRWDMCPYKTTQLPSLCKHQIPLSPASVAILLYHLVCISKKCTFTACIAISSYYW